MGLHIFWTHGIGYTPPNNFCEELKSLFQLLTFAVGKGRPIPSVLKKIFKKNNKRMDIRLYLRDET